MKNKEYKRKTYIINKKFQFRFVATFLVLVIIALLLFSTGFAGYYWMRYMQGDNIYDEFIFIRKTVKTYDDATGEFTGTKSVELPPVNRFGLILPPILINNIIIMIVISIIGVFYSHRMAGPVYRIEKDIKRALAGERGFKIKLRKKDKLLHGLADKINLLLDELNKGKSV